MRHSMKLTTAAIATSMVMATGATAATATFFNGIEDGRNQFNALVGAAGGTVDVDTLSSVASGVTANRGDYTMKQNDSGSMSWFNVGTTSGQMTSIAPYRNDGGFDSGARTNPLDYFDSGITLTFGTAVNAIGFEVDDWATCCHAPVTELFISFDGGAPLLVASATSTADGLFDSQDPSQTGSVYEIFVGAIDDTGDFTTVSFWGNGLGEVLNFGGEVRYSLIDQGSLPPSEVPLPAAGFLLIGAMGGLVGLRRRRKS